MRRLILPIVCILMFFVTACAAPGEALPPGNGAGNGPAVIGGPAEANQLPLKAVPAHPFHGEYSGGHIDLYNSDVIDWLAPLGIDPVVRTVSVSPFVGLCGFQNVTPDGYIVSACGTVDQSAGLDLTIFDPDTLEIEDRFRLPFFSVFEFIFGGQPTLEDIIEFVEGLLDDNDHDLNIAADIPLAGGAYFHLDEQGRAFVGNGDNILQIIDIISTADGPRWQLVEARDLGAYVSEPFSLVDVVPDVEGNYWFVTIDGLIGRIDAVTDAVTTLQLPVGERIENSVALDETSLYVVTDTALYRVDPDSADIPTIGWRETYEVGTTPKIGQISTGSGVTPTLLGDDLVTITDNAESQINLLVFNRNQTAARGRLICKIPLFEPDASLAEVSPIGYGNSIIVENNYGAPGLGGSFRGLAPGLTRIDVRPDRTGCDVVWDLEIASTNVPKLSTRTGLIYVYTQNLETRPNIDVWYLAAVDFETGELVFGIKAGAGIARANYWGTTAIGPDGTVYQGVVGGLLSIQDQPIDPFEPARTTSSETNRVEFGPEWASQLEQWRREDPVRTAYLELLIGRLYGR